MNKEQIELMKKLKIEGSTTREIAKKLNISQATVCYWLSNREQVIERNKIYSKNLSKEKKKEKYNKSKEYFKNYFKERYKNDPEFRRKHIERVKRIKQFQKEIGGGKTR